MVVGDLCLPVRRQNGARLRAVGHHAPTGLEPKVIGTIGIGEITPGDAQIQRRDRAGRVVAEFAPGHHQAFEDIAMQKPCIVSIAQIDGAVRHLGLAWRAVELRCRRHIGECCHIHRNATRGQRCVAIERDRYKDGSDDREIEKGLVVVAVHSCTRNGQISGARMHQDCGRSWPLRQSTAPPPSTQSLKPPRL